MKTFLLVLFLSMSINCFSQFKAKNGDLISIGDTLIIGKASSQFGFDFITQGGQRMHPSHAGKNITVTDLKEMGKRGQEKTYLQFKGFGLVPVLIDYDNAFQTGEIINRNAAYNRDQAIAKLKEAKELLDLDVITQLEYDSIKSKLTPIIQLNN